MSENKIPENLIDALTELQKILPLDGKIFILLHNEEEVSARLHHSLGRHLRNTWGLWDENSPFYKWFFALGIRHADDMSGIIITTFYRRLNCIPLCVHEQIKKYKEYWERIKKECEDE